MCVGRLLAEGTIWLAVARILAAFDISKPKDAQGQDIEQTIRFIPQFTRHVFCCLRLRYASLSPRWRSHPEPYECVIAPRSDRAKGLVNQAYYNTYQATHTDTGNVGTSKAE